MARRTNRRSNLASSLALACLCAMAPFGAGALAQVPEVTLKDLNLLHGLSDSGRWYGFGASSRYFLVNADSDTAIYSYFFGPTTTPRRVTADVEVLGRTDTSSIGLYCCEQEDGSKFLALLVEPDGSIALWQVDPTAGESNTIESYDILDDPMHAALSITEVANGMEMSVNGQSLGTYTSGNIRAGNVGLYVWGQGAYAINNFAIYYADSQPPQEEEPSGFNTLFGKSLQLEESDATR